MTSQTSSNDNRKLRKKVFLHAFRSTFRFDMVGINMAALVFLLFLFMVMIQDNDITNAKISNPGIGYHLTNWYHASLLFGVLAVQAIATAIQIFGFMFNMRAATAYLSLPISRGRLFISKYLAGLIAITVPFLLYLTLLFAVNLQVIGYSTILAQGYLVLAFGAFVTLFTVYSITSAISFCGSTVIEGIAFAVTVLFGPILLANSTTRICYLFLRGNYFGVTYGFSNTYYNSLSDYIMPYLPGWNFVLLVRNYSHSNNGDAMFHISAWWESGIAVLFIWLILSIAVSVLAFAWIKRYRAENAGILGSNRPLCFLATFIFVYYSYSLLFDSVNASNMTFFLMGLLCSAAVFLVCRYLFTRDWKETFSFRSLKQYGIIMSVIVFVSVACIAGMFGFGSRQPELGQIEAATITYAGAPDFIIGDSREFGNYSTTAGGATRQSLYAREFLDLKYTSESDIQAILGIHKMLIDARPKLLSNGKQAISDNEKDTLTSQIQIAYLLKNGESLIRLYRYMTPDVAKGLLLLDETEEVGRRITESFARLSEVEDMGHIVVSDGLFGNEYTLGLDEMKGLLQVILMDIGELPLESKYFPEQPARAIISFPRITPDGKYEPTILGDMSSIKTTTAYEDLTQAQLFSQSTNIMRLYITDDYIHTIEYLREKGIVIDEEVNYADVKRIFVQRYIINPLISPIQTFYFRSYRDDIVSLVGAFEIDRNEYINILNLSKNSYYTAHGGYLVMVGINVNQSEEWEWEDLQWVHLFLPEEYSPQYIKDILG